MPYQWLYMKDNANAEGGKHKATYEVDDIINWNVPIRERRGTSIRHLILSDADVKFIENRFESSATSGDNRGIYNRLYMTGEGGGGESLRSFTDVVGVEGTTYHGAHITLQFGTGATVTGLGVAVRGTLTLPNEAMPVGGIYAALQAEIWAAGGSTQPDLVTELSFIRCVAGGDSGGRAEVDDKAYLLVIDGGGESSGNMVQSGATEGNYATAVRCKINGVDRWMMFANASG